MEYLEEWEAERDPDDWQIKAPAQRPDVELQRAEVMDTFKAALDKLSPAHREELILREVDGLSYEEIAQVMKIKKGTVMSRIFNARKSIQQYMEDVK